MNPESIRPWWGLAGSAWSIFLMLTPSLVACGADEACELSKACHLIETKTYGISPHVLTSSYEWDGDDPIQITTTSMDSLPGTDSVMRSHYSYDYMGRLETESFDVDTKNEYGMYYNTYYQIDYKHDDLSPIFKSFTPRSAEYQVSVRNLPLVVREIAYFDYVGNSLQSATYRDPSGGYLFELLYEYEGDCITKVISVAADGYRFVYEFEYDEQIASGIRSFGDRFYSLPHPSGSQGCNHNVIRLSNQRPDLFERRSQLHDVETYSYGYRNDGAPARVEYVLPGRRLRTDFFYECEPE